MTNIQIAPSILSADFSKLGEEIKAIEPYADMVHIDIMDGHFVPNITFGPSVIKAIRPLTNLPFDVHLMIAPADPFIEEFAKAGANILTIHPEAGPHPYRTLQLIRNLGCKAGIALNPGTSIDCIKPLLPVVDLILVMTVSPGFGGQAFLDNQINKIQEVRQLIDQTDHEILLEVDGGISPKTAPLVIKAGANILVAGNSVFNNGGASQYAENIQVLRKHS